MPMHNWTKVPPGTYHNFHYRWIAAIMDQLNAGLLPPGCFAMAEPASKPSTSLVMKAEIERYSLKANRIVVRHSSGEVLAIIELISPGNKSSISAIRSMVDKLVDLFYDGINLLVVDPFPPDPRDSNGIHALIWEQVNDEPFLLPPDRPLTCASYQASPTKTAWIEPISVGMELPVMPLVLWRKST